MDIVLIPGLWLDGSSWDEVVPVIEKAGHRAHALTLPGMVVGASRASITVADHIAAVVAVVDDLDPPDGVVLVGHSGGGAIAHAVADARPALVDRVVYVDAVPASDGDCINDSLPSLGGEVPLPDWSLFDDEDLVDLDDSLRATFRARAIPSPAQVAAGPIRLSDPRRHDVPATVIACEFPSAELRSLIDQGSPYTAELARLRDVSYIDLPTGHWPQFTRPVQLGEVILTALQAA
ncbi:Pimeloyl-ACP methyl ester carboxylesterase [Asanoa hainanensis]|uniref:Pimeloyl-ACP methyl ester carboxylesterase n=1 Tax=Asanoa hainanensis TaxID=560556 RepID=A0A239PFH4_9ACTN|nr:alpha/beta hydrolase [Asanoa hainanensis]SNT65763.1 Pimeloyl-ACP methyl ester carboxylesterase [Asanoa hainanensis]